VKILEKYNPQFELAGLLMTLLIAFQFYTLWQNPVVGDAPKIISMCFLISFEAIMVHSAMLMSALPKKVSLYGLFPFYGLFVLAFIAVAQDPIILIIYLVTVFNRMRFAFSDVTKVLKHQAILRSILAGLSYFIPMLLFIFNSKYIPKWGMTIDSLKEIGYPGDSGSAGLLFETPHVVIAFGFSYYCLLAIIEAFSLHPRFGAPFINYSKT